MQNKKGRFYQKQPFFVGNPTDYFLGGVVLVPVPEVPEPDVPKPLLPLLPEREVEVPLPEVPEPDMPEPVLPEPIEEPELDIPEPDMPDDPFFIEPLCDLLLIEDLLE